MKHRRHRLLLSLSFTLFVLSLFFFAVGLYHKEKIKFVFGAIGCITTAYWHRKNVIRELEFREHEDVFAPDAPETESPRLLPELMRETAIWAKNDTDEMIEILHEIEGPYQQVMYKLPSFTLQNNPSRPLKRATFEIEDVNGNLPNKEFSMLYFFQKYGYDCIEGPLPYHVILATADHLRRMDSEKFKLSIEYLESAAVILRNQTVAYFNGNK